MIKNENAPIVSFVMPCLNFGRHLKSCIDSILAVPRETVELIVADGGSKDDTVEILSSYGDRIRWLSEPDQGMTQAVNRGMALTRGRFISLMSADDVLIPEGYMQLVDVIREDTSIDMIYGDLELIRDDGSHIRNHSQWLIDDPLFWTKTLNSINFEGSIVTRDALERVKLEDGLYFNEKLALKAGYDYDLLIRMAYARCTFRKIGVPVLRRRRWDESYTIKLRQQSFAIGASIRKAYFEKYGLEYVPLTIEGNTY